MVSKNARPDEAATLMVPLRVPPNEFEASATRTVPPNVVRTLPSVSNASTFTSGEIGLPAETLFGCTRNARVPNAGPPPSPPEDVARPVRGSEGPAHPLATHRAAASMRVRACMRLVIVLSLRSRCAATVDVGHDRG